MGRGWGVGGGDGMERGVGWEWDGNGMGWDRDGMGLVGMWWDGMGRERTVRGGVKQARPRWGGVWGGGTGWYEMGLEVVLWGGT